MFRSVQALPFQRSANAVCRLVLVSSLPTARQALAAEHDTPVRSLTIDRGGVGGVCRCQPGAETCGPLPACAPGASPTSTAAAMLPMSTKREPRALSTMNPPQD